MLDKLLKLYEEALKIHIGTKTQDLVFHDFSKDVYEKLFDVFHKISEKFEDIDKGQYYNSLQGSKNRLYAIIEEVKGIIDAEKNNYSTGMDNLIRGLVDELEFLCGDARQFIEPEIEEEGYKENKAIVPKKLI